LPATLEVLDTLGIPVIGLGTEFFPRFTSAGDDTLRIPCSARDAAMAARMCAAHWEVNPGTGVLLANPPPAAYAMDALEMECAVEQAHRDATANSVHGPALTPYLLAHIAHATQGRSVEANIALLAANAQLAAHLAVELAQNIRA
jgi:pseudouridine-5'-phosphate glycosidase